MSDIYRGAPQHNHIDMGEDFVQHWKYVKKLKVGKGTRYFYDWDEWKAFLSGDNLDKKSVTSKAVSAASMVGKSKNKSSFIFEKVKSNPLETIKDKAKKGKEWFTSKTEKKDKDEKETNSSKKKEESKEVKNDFPKPVKENGTDENGNKYIAKVEINGKFRYFYSEDEYDAYVNRQKYMAEEPDFMKNVKKSDTPYTSEEDACMINPNFDKDLHYQYNCAECSAIYELRRRGYDVESNGITGILDEKYWQYNTSDRFKLMYENPKTQQLPETYDVQSTYNALMKEFNKNPPGSRGDFSFYWMDGNGGHSVVWEKDKKGNVKIIDTQASGTGYHTEYDVKTLAYCIDNAGSRGSYRASEATASITRTDNLKLKKGITEIYKDSGNKKNKPKGNHIQAIRENWVYNPVTNAHDLYLDAVDQKVQLSKKEKQTQYPEIGSKNKVTKANTSKSTTKNNIAESKAGQMKALKASGYSYAEIAKKLGLSPSTIAKYL